MPSKKKRKYIFVVGGVISGVGKGVTASSLAKILQDRGLTVTAIKIDPYVNVDAGTMNPTEHGEVFVLDDGLETDQDMGNYERFLNVTLSSINYMTTGSVYLSVIERERNLEFDGKCVEVVPHVPLEVIRRIKKAAENANADVTIIEVGGTAGEYQNVLFLEALRMMRAEQEGDVFTVMVSYLPVPSNLGEMKTKPTQYAVRTLNASGIQPDFIIARSRMPLDKKRKEKIAFFCSIPYGRVISAPDVESIYDIPINFEKEKIGDSISELIGISPKKKGSGMKKWRQFVKKIHSVKKPLKIAIIGKYFDTGAFILSDSYISVIEALKYSAYNAGRKPELEWLNSEDFKDKKKCKTLSQYDGVLIPGGFGKRGVEGKINAIEYVRKNGIPYFGLCYGMQLMVIEYARNVLKLKNANTREIDPKSKHLVIDVMENQKDNLKKKNYGGTMRLGSYPAQLASGTIAKEAYNKSRITERHRHRYEVNPEYIQDIENAGLVFSGKSPDGTLMEIAELPKKSHPFFLGTQFHPEFQAHPLSPHPLFDAFIDASIKRSKK